MHDAVDSKAEETIFFVSFHFWPRFISCLLGTAHELGVMQRLSLTALVKAWPCLLSRPFVLCQQGLRDSGTASFHECPPPHVFHAWLCLLSRLQQKTCLACEIMFVKHAFFITETHLVFFSVSFSSGSADLPPQVPSQDSQKLGIF